MTGHDPVHAGKVRVRVRVVASIFLLLLGLVLARAVQLQVLQSDHLGSLAREQWLRQIEMTPRRGPILDSSGVPLAVSIEAESFFLDARMAEGLPVKALAKALGIERSLIEKRLAEKKSFAWLLRRAGPDVSEAMRALKEAKTLSPEERKALGAVRAVREYRRFYPQKHLGAHLLGVVGIDDKGLEGIELQYDSLLKGEAQEVQALRDVKGRRLLSEPALPSHALVGATVQLTLDSALQHAAEEALARGVSKANAKSGVVVVTEPSSGAILAMATWPRFNANSRASAEQRRNRALADAWEPGSTFKSFTWAAAISDGLVLPHTQIEVGDGRLRMGRTTIGDSHRPKKPVISVTEAMAESSNVAIAKTAIRMGPERLMWWIDRFGFGARTELGLSGEARGLLQNPSRMGEVATATTSFGQGISTTPLQLSMALGALANGGRLMKPVLVRRVSAADGEVLFEGKPELVRQVIAPEVAAATAEMMVAVTRKGGTGTLGAIPGVNVAAKTGTAQKVDPLTRGYSKDKRFSSYMGFAPAEAPRVAVYVGIDEPQGTVYGGVVAGPVFKEVMSEALRRLGVETQKTSSALDERRGERAGVQVAASSAQFEEGFVEDGSLRAEAPRVEDGQRTVPELVGRTSRAAWRLLSVQGFEVEMEGSGRVVRQQPAGGSPLAPGGTVRLTLEGNTR